MTNMKYNYYDAMNKHYKKYRYWIAAFYVVVSIFIIIIISDIHESIIFNYSYYKNINTVAKAVKHTILVNADSTLLYNLSTPLEFEFPPLWKTYNEHFNKYLNRRYSLFASLYIHFDKEFISQFENCRIDDSLCVHNIFIIYDRLFELKDRNPSAVIPDNYPGNWGNDKKAEFIKMVNDTLQHCRNEEYINLSRNIIGKVGVNDIDADKSINELIKMSDASVAIWDNFLAKQTSIPYANIGMINSLLLDVLILIIAIISIYVQLLYINYKKYESLFEHPSNIVGHNPTFWQVVINVGVFSVRSKQLRKWTSLLINTILPCGITITITWILYIMHGIVITSVFMLIYLAIYIWISRKCFSVWR